MILTNEDATQGPKSPESQDFDYHLRKLCKTESEEVTEKGGEDSEV